MTEEEKEQQLRKKHPWIFWGLIFLAILLVLLDIWRIWSCFQDPCCEFHSWFASKDAICPVMRLP